MFSRPGINRLPAIGRLALLMFVVAAASIALTLVCVSWVLQKDLALLTHEVVADELAEYSAIYQHHGIESIRVAFEHEAHGVGHAAAVVSSDGRLLFRAPEIWPAIALWPELRPTQPVEIPRTVRLENGQRFFWAGVVLNDGNVFWYGKTDAEERRFDADVFRQLWLAGLFVGALSLIPILWFAKEIAAPLREFTIQARKFAGGATAGRLKAPQAVPELREFAAAFNAGLDRIERLTHALQFANDQLAHELRTPLARLRTRIENAGITDANPGIIEEVERISRLLQTILDVRAGENGLLFLQREPSDLTTLLQALIELYLPSAEAREIDLTFESDGECPVDIDRQRVSQAVSNLLDNALRHTRPGDKIQVTIRRHAHTGEISVADSGPGFPLGMDIWNRKARNEFSTGGHTGLGLGLSLVRVVAESHGGQATADVSHEKGAAISIWLPLRGEKQAGE